MDIHVKKVARLYFGDTSSPEETIFKRLKDGWNKVLENGIDYENLEVFDWEEWEGTFLADQAREVRVYMETLLENNTFPREDMRELLNLVLVWLGVKIKNFKFQYPGALSHARFLMQSNYSMKTTLLSRQLNIYTEEELNQIKGVASFVGLFHAAWYFKSPLASLSPMLHINTILQMKKVKQYMPDVADIVLASIDLHLWYITPQSIPLAIVDETLSAEQRSWLAVGLSNIERPTVLQR